MNWFKRLLRRRRAAVTRRWRKTAKLALHDVRYLSKRISTIHQEVDTDWRQTIELTRQRHEGQLVDAGDDIDDLRRNLDSAMQRAQDTDQRLEVEKLKSRLLTQDNKVYEQTIVAMTKQYEALVARVERFTAMETAKSQTAQTRADEGTVHDFDS